MRKLSEIQNEIAGLAHSIGVDSYECAALNTKVQQISQRIQGNISRMDQLNNEKHAPAENLPENLPLNEGPVQQPQK